jgi:cell division protein FtsQ
MPGGFLPVPSNGKRRMVPHKARHTWVLHKRLITRAAMALLCAVLLAGAFQARGGIMTAVHGVGDLLNGRMASLGFGIDAITITGQSIASEKSIIAALELDPHMSTIQFDVDAARAKIEALSAIASADIRKVYPNGLQISVVEAVPTARHWIDGQVYLIDARGEVLAGALETDADLPLVIGEGAGDDAMPMIRALEGFPELTTDLAALSRVADRRWDLVYTTGLHVKLPERGVAAALDNLSRLEAQSRILERDLDVIDLRVAGEVVVRVTEREDETSN